MAMGNMLRFEMPSLGGLVQASRDYFGATPDHLEEEADTTRYKSLLRRELDQSHMTSAERAAAEDIYRVRQALYGGD